MKLITRYARLSAWLSFATLVGLTLSLDYFLRSRDGNILDGGLSDNIYFGIPLTAATLVLPLLWHGTRNYRSVIFRLLETAGHLTLGFFAYALTSLLYVVDAGIDTL